MLVVYHLLVLCFVFVQVCGQHFLGEKCTLKNGALGVCKLFSECKQVRDDFENFKRFPQTLGFQGTQPIVCCEARTPGEISKQKCAEYARYVNVTRRSPVLKPGAGNITRFECGHRVVKLIVGGQLAGRLEFPHMAAVGYEPTPGDINWFCGGTIISERYILTAAHCLSDFYQGDAKWVKLGVTALNDTQFRQHIKVAERIPHPDYVIGSYYNDIGLIKLAKSARLHPYARPACLYTKPEIEAKKAIASGWGQTSFEDPGTNDLMKVTIDLFDHEYCNTSYQHQMDRKLKDGIKNDIQVCGGSVDEVLDTCQGDSGGPLQIYHIGDEVKCMYDIIGITSFGKSCTGSAGVYVRISHYIEWIENIVWP